MTNNEIVITMLNNYLFNYYDADNIILGYQNNYTPPINNDFVIATNLGLVHNPKNLTGVNSRQNYMHKYTILFSLLSNTKITIASTGLALADVAINFKEYT